MSDIDQTALNICLLCINNFKSWKIAPCNTCGVSPIIQWNDGDIDMPIDFALAIGYGG